MFYLRHPPLHFDFCAFSPVFCSHVGNWNSITLIFSGNVSRKFPYFLPSFGKFQDFWWNGRHPRFLKSAQNWKLRENYSGCDLQKISGSWDHWKESTKLLWHQNVAPKAHFGIFKAISSNFYTQYGSHKIQVLPISSSDVYDFHKNIDCPKKDLIPNFDLFHFLVSGVGVTSIQSREDW